MWVADQKPLGVAIYTRLMFKQSSTVTEATLIILSILDYQIICFPLEHQIDITSVIVYSIFIFRTSNNSDSVNIRDNCYRATNNNRNGDRFKSPK